MKVGVAISTVLEREDMAFENACAWERAGVTVGVTCVDEQKRGVGWNKNQGIATLMDNGCDHLFLADDDMHPLSRESWLRYVEGPQPHYSLSWGRSRLERTARDHTIWKWPRGVMLYQTREVIERVGGFRTDFRNGHEHVEFSRRIHQAGFTKHPFMDLRQEPRDWFHCEDWARPNESLVALGRRRKEISTVRRSGEDRDHNNDLLARLDGNTDFVEYR